MDFVLIRLFESVEAHRLSKEIAATFARRATHPVPKKLPPPPAELELAYKKEAEEVGITTDLREAHTLAASWLDPVLEGSAVGRWEPQRNEWIKRDPPE